MATGACGTSSPRSEPADGPRVADEPLAPSVVQMVADRDGIDEPTARERVADLLRLAAAAEQDAAAAQGEPTPLLEDARAAHLRRAALARLWLETDFEPRHRPQDIPADDPLLMRAAASAKNVHPRLHIACQLVALPTGETSTLAEKVEEARDPKWRAAARDLFDPVAARMQRYIPADDRDPCGLLSRLLPKQRHQTDQVTIRYEAGGFDLQACTERDADGTCLEPKFDPDWTSRVAEATGPGFLPPFSTRFGYHLVFVREILPPREADDPETDAFLRQQVHAKWQSEALREYLDELRRDKAVRIVAGGVTEVPRSGDAVAPR